MKLIIDAPDEIVEKGFEGPLTDEERQILIRAIGNGTLYEEPQGEYKIACDVLLSLEQIVRNSNSWEDSAVEAVHNAVQTATKCIHKRPRGEWIEANGTYYCSRCKHYAFDRQRFDFCQDCGADMRGAV